MREILFRGKDKQGITQKDWVYGDLTYMNYGVKFPTISNFGQRFGRCEDKYTPVDEETIGQFTGIFDKNLKKVFEGDIVKVYFVYITFLAKITFKGCSFCMERLDNKFYTYHLGPSYANDIEVVGNIHDNPELLENEVSNEDE